MTVLPGRKLGNSEFIIAIAVGLMFFLLPSDAKNQFESESICAGMMCISSFVLTVVMYFIIKRYDAVGAAMFTMSMLMVAGMVFSIINGINTSGKSYWPALSEYNIVSMFILWLVPFLVAVFIRIFSVGYSDTTSRRRCFARFMVLSMRSLLIIYIIVLVFKLVIPEQPSPGAGRQIILMTFSRIGPCLSGTHENGIAYIIWHCIILLPLTFYLTVLAPGCKVWHMLIIAFIFGVTVEALQYVLNTGSACTDDVIMYLVGAVLGTVLKRLFDRVRRAVTFGQDPCMLSFDYTPVARRSRTEIPEAAEDISEAKRE